MEIVHVKIDELKGSEYNPRKADEKEVSNIKESIGRFGLVEPIVVNNAPERKNIIIGGHLRWRAAKEMGKEEMPVVYINIPELEKEQELNLRLNKNLGSWDYDLLANFDEKMLIDVGFAENEIDEVFGLEKADEFDEKKEFEKAVKEPRGIKTGDIWQLGEHKLIIGDSTVRENWERLLGEERFEFMFTDPPYRLAYCKSRVRKVKTKDGWKLKGEREYSMVGETDKAGKAKGFGAKQNRTYDGIVERGVPEFDEWLSIAKDFQNTKGVNVMIFESWKNTHDLWEAVEKYWKIRNMVIWYLPNRHQGFSARGRFFNKYDVAPLAGDGQMNYEYEEEFDEYLKGKGQKLLDTYQIILFASDGKNTWNKAKGTKYWAVGDHIEYNAVTESESGQNVIFGTKPIQVLVPFIKTLSNRGSIVMEPYGGSGSTIIASEVMKRKCRAIEISPTYAEIIVNRWEKFTNQKASKL